MFEESKDLGASEQELLEIFRNADSGLKTKLISRFVRGFKKSYDRIKKMNHSDLEDKGPSILEAQVQIFDHLERTYLGSKVESPIEDARIMGELLGTFLGLMEYYIPGRHIGMTDDRFFWKKSSSRIATSLKVLKKNIKLKFIRNRILAIARKHAGKLDPQTEKLYVEIATQFA